MNAIAKILISSFILCCISLSTVGAQTTSEEFAYLVIDSDGSAHVYLVNPNTLQSTQLASIPLGVDEYIGSAFLSPTGEWVALEILINGNPSIRLFNLYNGETVSIIDDLVLPSRPLTIDSDFPILDWSSDGRYFSFHYAITSEQQGTYLYDIDTRTLVNLSHENASQYQLKWANYSPLLALVSMTCDELECSSATIEIYDPTTAITINTIDISSFSTNNFNQAVNFCELEWSPDDNYLTFFDFCDSSSLGGSREVHVINLDDNSVTQVTNLTPNDISPAESIFTATVDLAWENDNTILIGIETLEGQIFALPGIKSAYTLIYNTTLQNSTSDMRRRTGWAQTPNTLIAYLAYDYADDPIRGTIVANINVEISVLNGDSFEPQIVAPAGCFLTWNSDYSILSYLEEDIYDIYNCDRRFERLTFIDGATVTSFNVAETAIALGWFTVQSNTQPPTPNAGSDQTITDTDNSGSESVTLDGSASTDSDGTIVSYVWTENGVEIATGATPTVDLAVGIHTITLTVTDDDGLTATDEVVITVNAPPSFGVDSLTLINADTDVEIRTISSTGTETIDIASNDISLRADTDPATVGSVVFTVDGNVVATDNTTPYTIADENGADILPWNIALGQHTVVATPYSGADGTGDAGTPLTVQVNIVDSSFAVSSLTLINADTNADIRTLSTSATETVDIANNGISVRANTNPTTVGSVVFRLDGTNIKTESIAPYTIAGDQSNGTDYLPWNIAPGMYTLTVTPYTATGGGGDAGTPTTVQLEIIDSVQQNLNIVNFYLVDADTDQDIGILQEGAVIDIGTQNINIRAETNPPTVGSVRLEVNGHVDYRIETLAPYALGENDPGAFAPWLTPPGQYTLIATAYDGANATGTAGVPRTVNFTIINSTATCGGLSQEAENGTLVGTMVAANDAAASNGAYIHAPSNNRFSLSGRDRAFYCFTIPVSGTYRLRAWGYAASGANDSLYVEVGDDESLWDMDINTIYAPDYVNDRLGDDPTEYTLTAGEQWVTIYARELGARVDRLEFELVSAANEQAIYRVDAGNANTFTDGNGQIWEADNYFTGGEANNFPASDILNTSDDDLYETERSQSNNTGFSYSFPVTNGDYTVRLHFAEIWFVGGSGRGTVDTGNPPRRVFDVQIEGTTVLDEYNIATAAGGALTAHVETFNVTVTDGSLDINFPPATTDNPTIEAIEIVQVNGQ